MIDDNELESALRRFTVRGPDPRLRPIALEAWEPARLWGPAAAAAILVTWVGVHAWRMEPYRDPIRDNAVRAIAAALGGGDEAEGYAEAAVPPVADPAPPGLPEQPW